MRYWLILFFLAGAFTGIAQVSFKTLVPQQPVVSGESFQVQYIIEGADKVTSIKPPAFSSFRFVAGPNTYTGTVSTNKGISTLKNLVYTLEAVKPGSFIIPGATLVVNGEMYRSNDVVVQVISKREAVQRSNAESTPNWDYVLLPGENAEEKIKQNLFVKVAVDKRNCYVGEPVLATFKLYSRLQSKSDIAKNPGFYGFSVYDIISLQDNIAATERLNGKLFDVHTIRKVQLYPLQAGSFTIDPMEVLNKVEFATSAVSKKTEQQISEGLLGVHDDDKPGEGKAIYETNSSTEPVSITVKPLPERGRPAAFNGATGHFAIAAAVVKSRLSKNEEGLLEISIKGKGNFVQLDAPVIRWPAGMEGFAPAIKDSLDKSVVPLKGSRTFRFPFVCVNAGTYNLPAISFSFFDTDSNSYKTVSAKGLEVRVSNTVQRNSLPQKKNTSIAAQSEKASRIAVIIIASLVLAILLYWGLIKKEKPAAIIIPEKPALPAIPVLLEPVYLSMTGESNIFFRELHGATWNFLHQRFGFSGSEMNKQLVQSRMNDAGIDDNTIQQLLTVLSQCETGIFTNADLGDDKEALMQRIKTVLEKIDSVVS
jgi:hypothetical protein